MRKNLFFVVLFAIILTTGCGKSATATDRYTVGSSDNKNNNSTIENHSSPKNLSSNNSSLDSPEDISSEASLSEINVSNEGHEPDHYGTGNFQDYWKGNGFFDLKAYALANGCTSFSYITIDGDLTEDETKAVAYILYVEDKIKIYPFDTGIIITMKDGLEYDVLTNFNTKEKEWDGHLEESEQKSISKKNGAKLYLAGLCELDTIFKCIKNYKYDGSELLKDSGLHYIIDSTKQHLE